AGLALAVLSGVFLARRMVVPIKILRAGAARIGSGDLGQRIAIKTGDELEGLADQFNDMAGKLQESYADLEKKVEVRTTELARSVEELRALVVRRRQPGEFPKATIDLLQTFAAQSVLAIQNARLFSEIGEKSQQLEIASQHKSQFLANMSHELRTPLNAILGYTELILDNIYGETPQKMRTVLERVQSNGKHLLGLINDV